MPSLCIVAAVGTVNPLSTTSVSNFSLLYTVQPFLYGEDHIIQISTAHIGHWQDLLHRSAYHILSKAKNYSQNLIFPKDLKAQGKCEG